MPNRRLLILPLLCLLSIGSLVFALAVGSVPIGMAELWANLWHRQDELQAAVIHELRLPRALSAFVTGATLALAGALMQVLLRNPLADPYVLGVSGGAAVAALLSLLLGLSGSWVSGSAFLGAMISMVLVFGLSHGRGSWTSTRLLLTGVVIAAGWGALISFLLAVSPDTSLRGMLFWLMGDLSQTGMPGWHSLTLLVGLATSMAIARNLNLLSRGELQAGALGVSVTPLRAMLFFLGSLLTATAVTLAGTVGFIGLIVPHLLRLMIGSDHRLLLPSCVLLGGSLLVIADTLARTLIAPQQLPVGVLSALIGVPVFLVLLNRDVSNP